MICCLNQFGLHAKLTVGQRPRIELFCYRFALSIKSRYLFYFAFSKVIKILGSTYASKVDSVTALLLANVHITIMYVRSTVSFFRTEITNAVV